VIKLGSYPHQLHCLGVKREVGAGKQAENASGHSEGAEKQGHSQKYEEYGPRDDYELQGDLESKRNPVKFNPLIVGR